MPYKSKAQEAWAHTPEGEKALGGKDKVAEWDSASKGAALPDRIAPKKAKPVGIAKIRQIKNVKFGGKKGIF